MMCPCFLSSYFKPSKVKTKTETKHNTQINNEDQPKCTKGTVRTIHFHEWYLHFRVIGAGREGVHVYGHTLYGTP